VTTIPHHKLLCYPSQKIKETIILKKTMNQLSYIEVSNRNMGKFFFFTTNTGQFIMG